MHRETVDERCEPNARQSKSTPESPGPSEHCRPAVYSPAKLHFYNNLTELQIGADYKAALSLSLSRPIYSTVDIRPLDKLCVVRPVYLLDNWRRSTAGRMQRYCQPAADGECGRSVSGLRFSFMLAIIILYWTFCCTRDSTPVRSTCKLTLQFYIVQVRVK